ncbi:MAG: hypothetical protein L6Q76_07805 [Polyangiaceae bacterium]|nr:hypothetical protein [Polyangiaceae bacterium]
MAALNSLEVPKSDSEHLGNLLLRETFFGTQLGDSTADVANYALRILDGHACDRESACIP